MSFRLTLCDAEKQFCLNLENRHRRRRQAENINLSQHGADSTRICVHTRCETIVHLEELLAYESNNGFRIAVIAT